MIYLSGHVNDGVMEREHTGVMLTPRMGNNPDLSTTHWAADTGMFSQPDKFNLHEYLRWLVRKPRATCLFATAPDVVGDADATWELAAPVLPVLRAHGFIAAVVAQDGLTDPLWDEFDCLFVGGTTAWKLSETAYGLVREAKERGKWAHMGRVNSWRRLKACAVSGYDSVDGTYLAFGPDRNLPKLNRWLETLNSNPRLGVTT